MWDALTKMYQSSNENRKMVLREKLKCICMAKGDSVTFYLTQIKQVRDELSAVGDQILETELVRTTLFGLWSGQYLGHLCSGCCWQREHAFLGSSLG